MMSSSLGFTLSLTKPPQTSPPPQDLYEETQSPETFTAFSQTTYERVLSHQKFQLTYFRIQTLVQLSELFFELQRLFCVLRK